MLRLILAILLYAAWTPIANADENTVRDAFMARFQGVKPDSVTRMPIGGLYEIIFEGQIVYTDEKMTFLMSGNLIDLRGKGERNLTRERTNQIAADALVKSQDAAIKRVKGNGKRVIYTFEDPNCAYCKQLQKELNKVTDVTIYTFLWPILSPDSIEKSKAIWCAKDRARAWDDAMNKSVIPTGSKDCETPLDRNMQMARRFGINGTPSIYLANGQQIGGYIPADKLEQALTSVSR
jgi:thiol:disulfide interchange protein DsbC